MQRVRLWVQGLATLLVNGSWEFPVTRTIYQGPLKVLCAPGLNCYSCPAATTSCPIGALQQLLGGVQSALASGQFYLGLYVIGFMGLMGGILGRGVCGWLCPFGLLQDLLYKIPSRKIAIAAGLRYVKYFFLAFFVVLLPLLVMNPGGSGELWFCKYICPAGTLTAGLPLLLMQPSLRQAVGLLFLNKLLIMILFLGWSVYASRPFCRTSCPLGAFYALFAKVRLVRLRLDASRCTNCKACHQVCPMGVRFNENPDDPECISCLACMNQACEFDAISLEIGGQPVGATAGNPETTSSGTVRQGK